MFQDFVFQPEVDSTSVETLPYRPNANDQKIQLLGQQFLDMFLRNSGTEVAADPSFKIVRPIDDDPGGPESPEAMAALDAGIRRLRESGLFDRGRERLRQSGFPIGGV
jgi:hypothetical protein